MIISLYLNNKILNFKLPTMISGSYTFDFEENEGSLINIDGTVGKWFLYQTNDVKIIENNQYVEKLELISNKFYIVERDNKKYLLYVYNVAQTNMIAFGYDEKTKLIISNKDGANIKYDCALLEQKAIQINLAKGIIVNNPQKVKIYLNKYNVVEENFKIEIGDTLEIYGLRITFLPNILLINNLKEKINVNMASANLINYDFGNDEEPQDLEVKNLNLYNENDYFSKSPRLRRIIKTKNIKLTAPPRDEDKNQLPLILTIGPMLTMAITSLTMLSNTIIKITNNETTLEKSWPQLVTSGVMLVSMLVWPLVTRWYNDRMKKKRKAEIHEKYNKYLDGKRKELDEEAKQQKIILFENLITIEDCLEILKRKNINFWDKRIDQSDFLTVRIGNGNELLDAKVEYPDEDFTIDENDLRDAADKLVADYKYIYNVPIGYSFYENVMTNIMGKV